MKYLAFSLLVGLVVMTTVGCGYHLRTNSNHVPIQMKTITLHCNDPYGPLSRAVRKELHFNSVTLIEDANNTNLTLPSLRIITSSINKRTISVFQDGKTAEYEIMLSVQAHVLLPGKDYYPINVRVSRSFFDNPLTALAKDDEENIILQELRQEAANQLVRKLFQVYEK